MKTKHLFLFLITFSHLGSAGCQKMMPTETGSGFFEQPSQIPTPNLDYGSAKPAEGRLRLSSRKVISSTLLEIFGPSIQTSLTTRVSLEIGHFGGPCDPNQNLDCTGSGESQAPMIPLATTPRMALITRLCDQIVESDTAIQFAIQQALEAAALPSQIPNPTPATLATAYDLFQPGLTAPSNVIDGLKEVADAAESVPNSVGALDSWRFVFLTLCLNPTWQVL
jgi:hypothetical protein